jgi:hypothetical protein
MIPDKLLINLKILSKIQKNGRIARSYDGIISLENDAVYQSIKRFLSNDSRKQAVFEINSIINECIDTLNNFSNSKYMTKDNYYTEEYLRNCENMHLILAEMQLARGGILNLKFTYQADYNISSQLDIIILKMNTAIRDFGHKLAYFQNFLKNYYGDNFTPHNQYHNETCNELNNISIQNTNNSETNEISENDNENDNINIQMNSIV